MRRATLIFILFSFFPLAFLPGDAYGGSACSNALTPPFITSGVKPNILIILDNSNSMDEDFYGNAVGSYSPASKTVVAKQALQQVVTNLQGKADVGIMTYSLPNDIVGMQIHNAMPFASYNPKSYCPNPPPECNTYCMSQDPSAQSVCEAACPGLTTTTYDNGTNFPDLIITYYPPTTDPNSTRARYCGLAYPKTQRWPNPTDPGNYIYYNQTDPFYDWGDDGILFGYSGGDDPLSGYSPYSPAENAANVYTYCNSKVGISDLWNGYNLSTYCTNYQFEPTDSDWALGFYNWGQMMPWYWVGPTWFSWSQGSGSPQGYLHVPVADLSNPTQYNNVYNILNPYANNSAGYMSCTAGDKNTCPYIINASNTPTAGTLNTAFNYFNGQLGGQSSPITSPCQKNYIIYATDGLPSTFMNGSQPTPDPTVNSNLLQEVLTQISGLQTGVSQTIGGTKYTFPVKTYVLGMGLTTDAKSNLDKMAVAGGTATSTGHAYYADNPGEFADALNTIITDLLGRVSAGSSISILSEGQSQNGDNMLQGVFYPSKYFGTASVTWPGYLYNYWFYNSQTYNNMREDTIHDYILELNGDDGISFIFDPQTGLSVNRYSDPTGSGNPTTFVNNVGLDSLTPIWEAGMQLFQTPAASRQILTPGSNSNNSGLVSFNTSNATLTTPASSPLGNPSVTPSTFDPCLQPPGTSNKAILQNLINYVQGTDITNNFCSNGTSFNSTPCNSNSDCKTAPYTTCATYSSCRSRTVGLCSNGTAFNNIPCNSSSDCTAPYGTCTQNVWKLGDIVYSTPQVKSDYMYCSNGTSFNNTPCSQNSDCSGAYSSCQKKQSVIFVGANDGMLHAFQTGVLTNQGLDPSQSQVEALTGIPTASMGQELWGFIPTNTLPYLRCLAAPPPNSCHLYYNDLSPYITNMAVTSKDANGQPIQVTKTVLIGGMRFGGGSVTSTGNYCFNASGASNGQTCTSNSNCTTAPYTSSCSNAYLINAPSDTCNPVQCSDPTTCYNPPSCIGLSSYYALDITDAQNPILLWEFSHPLMGYSYSGPAVIHKWSSTTGPSGDQYYVMFLSGPTSGADGSSIQDVQAFVLTLDTANLGIDSVFYKDLGATTKNGFGGRLFTPGLDVNTDGYTDFVFFGYENSLNGSSTDWTGGIGKVYTSKATTDSNGHPVIDYSGSLSPSNWTYDIGTYAGIATLPITAKIATEQCFNTWYLYSGTGRYFSAQDNYGFTPAHSSAQTPNYLMGIPFTCDQFNNSCTNIASLNSLNATTTACSTVEQGASGLNQAGWEYPLNVGSGPYLNERLITDPTTSSTNTIFFVTAEPTNDQCGYGGQSRVWGMNCATGGPITQSCGTYTVANLSGTMYLQTSTGAIYNINAATSFTDSSTGNRTTPWFVGMPPETSAPVVQPTTPLSQVGRVIQWIEK